jgi:hypothetical protein
MEVTRPRTVLIASAESLSAPEVVWSLVEAGFDVHVASEDPARAPLRRCPSITLHEVASPATDRDGALADLQRLVSSLTPDAVMPLNDRALWLFERLELPPSTVNLGPQGTQARLALDKRRQVGAALMAGLAVPATGFFDSVEEALATWSQFPVIVRPFDATEPIGTGLGSRPRRACSNRAELERALEPYAEEPVFFLQPFAHGVGEGLFGLARKGEVLAWSAHRRVRMMSPYGSGSSACVPAQIDDALLEPAAKLVRDAAWDGIFMIELLREPGLPPWFIELNGRAWGSMALSRRMGLEYPAWAVESALDEDFVPDVPADRDPVMARHLGRELVHLLIVLRGPRYGSLPPWPSRAQTLRQVVRVGRRDRFYNLRRGSVPLFLDDTLTTVRSAIGESRR